MHTGKTSLMEEFSEISTAELLNCESCSFATQTSLTTSYKNFCLQ